MPEEKDKLITWWHKNPDNRCEGKLITCDRCGRSIFLKYLGEEILTKGMTVRYDRFESMPDTWLYERPIGYLCDNCACLFRKWVTEFTDGHVAPIWHVDRHKKPDVNHEQKDCDVKCE